MHACIGEGNGNPVQYSSLENPRNRGAWWAAVHRVAQSQTRLKRLSLRALGVSRLWEDILFQLTDESGYMSVFFAASSVSSPQISKHESLILLLYSCSHGLGEPWWMQVATVDRTRRTDEWTCPDPFNTAALKLPKACVEIVALWRRRVLQGNLPEPQKMQQTQWLWEASTSLPMGCWGARHQIAFWVFIVVWFSDFFFLLCYKL